MGIQCVILSVRLQYTLDPQAYAPVSSSPTITASLLPSAPNRRTSAATGLPAPRTSPAHEGLLFRIKGLCPPEFRKYDSIYIAVLAAGQPSSGCPLDLDHANALRVQSFTPVMISIWYVAGSGAASAANPRALPRV